jgi:acyl-CoA thioesterase-2
MYLMLTAKQLIDLAPLASQKYCSRHTLDNGTGTMFGGQLLALSLAAAQREAPDWPVHSLSGNFLRSSRIDMPLDLVVSRTSDSRRFSCRHVLAMQQGQSIFEALCSFHDQEPGIEYQAPFDTGGIPSADSLPNLKEFATAHAEHFPAQSIRHYTQSFPVEMRLIDPDSFLPQAKRKPHRSYWFRIEAAASLDDSRDHQSLLALMSDYWLPSTGSALNDASGMTGLMVLSLNHSMRFHAHARVDDWLLYRTETTWAGNSRALAHGQIYDADFRLIASVSQEYLLRQIARP